MQEKNVTEWQIMFTMTSGLEDFYTEDEAEYNEKFQDLIDDGDLQYVEQCIRKDYVWNEETETWDEDWVEVLYDAENYDDYKDTQRGSVRNEYKYKVSSYYDMKYLGLEDTFYTNDWTEVEDEAHKKLMQGNCVLIQNLMTGKEIKLSPDEYDETFDGEFIVRPEELDEAKELSDEWKEKMGNNVHNFPEYEFRALRYAEIYGIEDYEIKDNIMIYIEKLPYEGTFEHKINLDTMKQISAEQIGPGYMKNKEDDEDIPTYKPVIKSYNETDYGWHNNATTIYGELLDGNWYSYVPDNESIEIYNAPITNKYIDTAYNYQTNDERADDEWFDKFQQEHNITSKYTQKEIFNLIDELDAKYFNRTNYKPVEESKKVEERYNIFTISEDGPNVYNSHKVDTVDTIEQAEDRVAEIQAETGNNAYYEKVDEWWDKNAERVINYAGKETPEVIAELVYDGNIDEYMQNTSKQIALDIYNQLGKEETEKLLNEFDATKKHSKKFNGLSKEGAKIDMNKVEAKTVNNETLKQAIEKVVLKYMTGPNCGFDEDEAKDYFIVEIEPNGNETVVEVRVELDYDSMMELSELLNKVITKYDKDAYFDMVSSGIISAVISKQVSKKEESIVRCDKCGKQIDLDYNSEEYIFDEKSNCGMCIDCAGCDYPDKEEPLFVKKGSCKKAKKTEAEDMSLVKDEVETAVDKAQDITELDIEQIKGSLDVLKTDEESAIAGYESFIEETKKIVDAELANEIEKQMQEIIKDEKEHIEKIETIKAALGKDKEVKTEARKNNKQLDYKLDGFKGVTISVVDKKNGINTEKYIKFDSMEFGIDEYEFKDSMVTDIKDTLTNIYEVSDAYYDDVFTSDEITEMAKDITQDVLQLYDDLPEENIDRENGYANLDESKSITEANTFGIAEDMYNRTHKDKWHTLSDDEKASYYNMNYKRIKKQADNLDKKAEAVDVEADMQNQDTDDIVDTENELLAGIKKEVYAYCKQKGLDIEKLRKQGVQLEALADTIDKVVGDMVSDAAIEYMDRVGYDIMWDFEIKDNDIRIIYNKI